MVNVKGIILDIDGVIVGEKIGFNSPNPHQEVINKLNTISKKGVKIILCTAKPHFSIRTIINDCRLDNLHITDGGSVIINPLDNNIVKKHVIDKDAAKKILNVYIENNVYTEFYTVDNYVIQNSQICDITDKHTHILQQEPKIVQSLTQESLNNEITKIIPVALDEKDKERVETLFKQVDTNLTLTWGIHPIALPLQFGIITAARDIKKTGSN